MTHRACHHVHCLTCNHCSTETQLGAKAAQRHKNSQGGAFTAASSQLKHAGSEQNHRQRQDTQGQTANQQNHTAAAAASARGYGNLLLLEVPSDSTTTQVGGMEACIGVRCTDQGLHQSVLGRGNTLNLIVFFRSIGCRPAMK